MNLSANDIIAKALAEARVIYPGASIPSGKGTAAFDQLNGLLESWSIEGLKIRSDTLESFSLVSGQTNYTYGSGGNFDSEYPTHIYDSTFIRQGDTDYPCKLIPMEQYRGAVTKNTSGISYYFAVDYDYPLATVYFFPVPEAADTVHFKVAKELDLFVDRTTQTDLPPGMGRALIANLAIELSSSYGKKVSKELAKKADDSLTAVMRDINRKKKNKMKNTHLSALTNRGRTGNNILTGPFGNNR